MPSNSDVAVTEADKAKAEEANWCRAWHDLRCLVADTLIGMAFSAYPDGEPEKLKLAAFILRDMDAGH